MSSREVHAGAGHAAPGWLRVLAVDDERPALADLARLLESSAPVAEVIVASSGEEALARLADEDVDAVFLDVRMPGLDGLALGTILGRFAQPPALVFVSAFEDGAVGAFEHDLHPLDYLMKPVSRARVEQALGRVMNEGSRLEGAAAPGSPHPGRAGEALPEGTTDEIIPVEHQRGNATKLLQRSTILYVKAEGDYVRLHSDSGRYLVRGALSEVEHRWGRYGFVRVHRSFVANLRRATEIRPELGGGAIVVMADGSEVPVARRQVAELRRRLRQQ